MLPKINRIKGITAFEHATRAYLRSSLGGELSKRDCATCPQTIWINVFFDGTGNNFREDERFRYAAPRAKQSNIAKLAFLHGKRRRSISSRRIRKKQITAFMFQDQGHHFPKLATRGLGTKSWEMSFPGMAKSVLNGPWTA